MKTFLTVLVARLPERFALGEDDGDDEILEGRHVEEAGVLEVLDVVVVHFCLVVVGHVDVGRRLVAGAA